MENKELRVFVYGTLKVGGKFAGRYDEFRKTVKKGTIKGKMFSVHNSFPGVLLNGEDTIHGEIHEYADPDGKVLSSLNRLEGFITEGNKNNLYNQRFVKVSTDEGEYECLMYEFNRPTDELSQVKTGVWKI